jgi:hypothetical protein
LKKTSFQIEIYFQKSIFKSGNKFQIHFIIVVEISFQIEFIGKTQFKFEFLFKKITSKDKSEIHFDVMKTQVCSSSSSSSSSSFLPLP